MKEKSTKQILVIEDDRHIAEGLQLNLKMKGYDVHIASDGASGLRQWKEIHPDLIVLDIMLPGIDGMSVLRNIRLEDERLPILILSAKADIDDKIEGLAFGVDDYLSKPFHLDEFLLRVERLLLRGDWSKGKDKLMPAAPQTFEFGDNRIDFSTSTAQCANGKTVRLTEQEIKLLKLFISNRGKPLSRGKLLEIGWSYTGRTTTRTVDNFIVRIRKYFEKNPKKPVYFKSLRSVGYVFDDKVEQ
ncbi:MAG: response regulator transcription factor [Desulfobacteraceae bacterium]|nr:response regulator transcription factor [Desulfobacteraceae bacterium]